MRASNIGRYELLEELSRGGMGVVYKARDPLIDRVVAIKTIGMGLSRAESEQFDRQFDREARSAGRLNHPNIVTIYDMGRSDDGAYIAMEFLDGRSLRDILDTGVVLEPARVAQIAAQVGGGLAYAHEHGVIHCDVKPANIMVLASGLVKITDFGIARLPSGSRTFAGNVFGSPRYISPEQILGRPVDARSDIFSLGAVIYEMLTGVPPFGGGQLDEILFQVINDKPEAASSRNPKAPAAFDAIVERALAKSPDDRYASAAEMAADLRKLVPSEAGAAPPTLPVTTGRKRKSKRDSTTTVLISGPDGDGSIVLDANAGALDVDTLRLARVRRNLAIYGAPLVAMAVLGIWLVLAKSAPDSAPRNAAAVAVVAAPAPIAMMMPTAEPAQSVPALPTVAATDVPPSARASVATTKAKSAPPRPQAKIWFAVTPWGEIFVDGHKRGVSPPLTELALAPGRHTIEIRNSTFASHRETLDVLVDANVRIRHKFE